MARFARRLLLLLVVLVGGAVAAVALLPTLISHGMGRGLITRAIAEPLQGTVAIDGLHLAWFSRQSVRGFRLTDTAGREVANLDLDLSAGLLDLCTGAAKTLKIKLGGTVSGELRKDGGTSFGDVLARAGDSGRAGTAPAPGPPDLSAVPPTEIEITGLTLSLDLPTSSGSRTLVVDGLSGHAAYVPGGTCTLALSGPTSDGTRDGSIDVQASAAGLFNSAGIMTPAGASLTASAAVRSVPVPFDERVDELLRLDVGVRADDLGRRLDLDFRSDTLAAGTTSVLRGTVSLEAPLAADGTLHLAGEAVTAEISGQSVPSALLQPLLAGVPVVLADDLGPTLNIHANLTPLGQGAGRVVNVSLLAERASLVIDATIADDGAIEGRALTAGVELSPALLERLTGGGGSVPALAGPVQARLTLDSFAVPASGAGGGRPLAAVAANGHLELGRPGAEVGLRLPGTEAHPEPIALTARDVRVAFVTTALGEGLHLTASAAVAGGRVEIDEQVRDLLDAEGALAAAGARPQGSVKLIGIDGGQAAALLGALGAGGDFPGAEALFENLLAGEIGATVTTTPAGGGLAAALDAATGAVEITAGLRQQPGAVEVERATVTLTVTPSLLAALQEGREEPVALAAPVTATVALGPALIPFPAAAGTPEPPAEPLHADLTLSETTIRHASLETPLVIGGLTARVDLTPGREMSVALQGEAAVGPTGDRRLGRVSCELSATGEGQDGSFVPRGTVAVADLDLGAVETVLGLVPAALSGWIGTTGRIDAELSGEGGRGRATVRSAFPNLRGTMVATLEKDAFSAQAEGKGLMITVQREALEKILNPPAAAGGQEGYELAVGEDVPMTVALRGLRVPLALARGETFDPAAVTLHATLEGGPLTLRGQSGESRMEHLSINLNTDDLSAGVSFAVHGRVAAAGAGTLDIDGSIRNLVAEDSTFDRQGAAVDLVARAEGVPTIIADAFLGLNQFLVAAVGPEMSSTLTAEGFSRSGGRVDLDLRTTNGALAGRVLSGAGELRTTSDVPVHGHLALTPPLRDRLLSRIHPMLADIRTTEQPIRFRVTEPARVPTDGDLRKLNGDLEITIGKVEFTSGSLMLGVLQIFAGGGAETIPGSIEPIVARIRKGVITYDRFAVHIDKYVLVYQGTIDLPRNRIDLRTEIPLEALASTFHELKGLHDIVVPFVTRGTFQDNTTKIDPDFDIVGKGVEAGVGDLIKGALEKNKVPKEVGELIGDIFGGKKKKKK